MTIAIKPTASGSTIEQNGSTILTVDGSGNIAIANDLTVTGSSPLPTGPAFSATSSANTSASSGVLTKLVLDTEQFDTNSNFDNTTNYRFTPTVAGYYQINGIVITPSNADSTTIVIYKNGSNYVSTVAFHATIGVTNRYNISVLLYLNGSTDYIELYAAQYGGTVLVAGATMNGSLVRAA